MTAERHTVRACVSYLARTMGADGTDTETEGVVHASHLGAC